MDEEEHSGLQDLVQVNIGGKFVVGTGKTVVGKIVML